MATLERNHALGPAELMGLLREDAGDDQEVPNENEGTGNEVERATNERATKELEHNDITRGIPTLEEFQIPALELDGNTKTGDATNSPSLPGSAPVRPPLGRKPTIKFGPDAKAVTRPRVKRATTSPYPAERVLEKSSVAEPTDAYATAPTTPNTRPLLNRSAFSTFSFSNVKRSLTNITSPGSGSPKERMRPIMRGRTFRRHADQFDDGSLKGMRRESEAHDKKADDMSMSTVKYQDSASGSSFGDGTGGEFQGEREHMDLGKGKAIKASA